jgi:hypothetical protein
MPASLHDCGCRSSSYVSNKRWIINLVHQTPRKPLDDSDFRGVGEERRGDDCCILPGSVRDSF